jgi:hypothetical protein
METCSTSAKTSEPVLPFRFRRRASDFLAFRTCFGTCSVKKKLWHVDWAACREIIMYKMSSMPFKIKK